MSQHPIEDLIQKGDNNPNKIVGNLMYILMRDLHLGYREIKKMPLCDILELIKRWNKEQKETEKEMKKTRRK
jgi:hypothetical protein